MTHSANLSSATGAFAGRGSNLDEMVLRAAAGRSGARFASTSGPVGPRSRGTLTMPTATWPECMLEPIPRRGSAREHGICDNTEMTKVHDSTALESFADGARSASHCRPRDTRI
jgi:hypothetical protein